MYTSKYLEGHHVGVDEVALGHVRVVLIPPVVHPVLRRRLHRIRDVVVAACGGLDVVRVFGGVLEALDELGRVLAGEIRVLRR